MSGGVDSSVAASLIKGEGHEVIGVAMRIGSGEEGSGSRGWSSCYGPGEERDLEDAREVARNLGISFHVFDLRKEFNDKVLDYLCREYSEGRTPNPCVICNREVKFEALLNKVETEIGVEFMATGHYARVEHDETANRYLLKKARDVNKDQSYFLFSLSQEQLQHSLFPLGDYTKGEVRKISHDLGLRVHEKPESQDFAAGDYSSVLRLERNPGPIIDTEGRIVGEHDGIHLYTVGQRKGLGIARGYPLYVVAIERERNALIVGGERELYLDEVDVAELNWIAGEPSIEPQKVKARIRYRHQEAEAVVHSSGDGKARVKFDKPQRAIAPGQAMVFYDGDVVVGGGIIGQVRRQKQHGQSNCRMH